MRQRRIRMAVPTVNQLFDVTILAAGGQVEYGRRCPRPVPVDGGRMRTSFRSMNRCLLRLVHVRLPWEVRCSLFAPHSPAGRGGGIPGR
ncbi:MAG: hypothetical protein MZU95_01360 [Desulfomicrobium escambiense]|nr:hypothetical protein [Desulfomicrobium escambiense]